MRLGLRPSPHILFKRLLELLLAEVDGLLVPPNHAHLRARGHVREAEVVVVQTLLDGAFDLAGQDVGAETRFLADGAGEPDGVDGVEGFDLREILELVRF